jgi:hypothetical protein
MFELYLAIKQIIIEYIIIFIFLIKWTVKHEKKLIAIIKKELRGT